MTERSVGALIRERRLALGLSQRALAKQLGVSQPLVVRIETGEREVTMRTARKMADVLGWEVIREVIEEGRDA